MLLDIKRSTQIFIYVLLASNVFYAAQVHAADSKINGVEIYGNLIIDSFSNRSGGLATGTASFALFDFGVDMDLEILANWKNTSLHIGALWGEGDDPSADVGDFNTLSNIVMPVGGRLFEVYLEKSFDAGKLTRIKAGMIGLDGDFQGCDYSAPFINSGFGVVSTISGNLPTPIFPQAALGIVVAYAITESSYLQFGLYDGDAGSDIHGTDIDLDSTQGLALLVEYGADAFNGDYKIGVLYHTGDFVDIRDSSVVASNTSFYFTINQTLTMNKSGDPKLGGFMRLGLSPQKERNTVKSHIDFGIQMFEPLSGRENDLFGIGFIYTGFSDDFITSEILASNVANDAESIVEIFYQAEITPWLSLKPDLQLIKNPLTSKDAIVAGLRMEASF